MTSGPVARPVAGHVAGHSIGRARFGLTDVAVERAHRMLTVRHLLERCHEADGRPPFGDHALAAADDADGPSRAVIVRDRCGLPVVLAQATLTDRSSPTWTIDIAIDPRNRQDHAVLFDLVFRSMLDRVEAEGGGAIRWWSHADDDPGRAIVDAHGFEAHRRLHRMDAALATAVRPAIATRSFRPGVDDEAVLAVNNDAFAGHPDQGDWTRSTLAARCSSAWFDRHGLRLYVVDDEVIGFCWTKVHDTGDGRIGEIYVVALRRDRQRAGLGTALVEAGLAELRARSLDRAMLFVDDDNAAAIAVYRRLGFAITSTSVAFHRPPDAMADDARRRATATGSRASR